MPPNIINKNNKKNTIITKNNKNKTLDFKIFQTHMIFIGLTYSLTFVNSLLIFLHTIYTHLYLQKYKSVLYCTIW